MTRAYLGLGANLGDPAAQLREAIRRLRAGAIENVRVSPFYRTRPVGVTDQPWFVNAVLACDTALAPEALLDLCLDVERTMGRVRELRWGPRVIDVDLLAYGEVRSDTDRLTLPHPRWHERGFVVKPLADLAPDLVIAGRKVSEVLASLDTSDMERLENAES